ISWQRCLVFGNRKSHRRRMQIDRLQRHSAVPSLASVLAAGHPESGRIWRTDDGCEPLVVHLLASRYLHCRQTLGKGTARLLFGGDALGIIASTETFLSHQSSCLSCLCARTARVRPNGVV